jgi:signal transduction histidine kinase
MSDLTPGPPSVTVDADALQELNRLRTVAKVFSNAAHDVNNALQVIGGSAELLALKAELGPAELRRVHAITAQTGRAATALDRLQSYTRSGESGRQIVDLSGLLEVATALRDFALRRAGITMTVESTAPCRASVDRRLILQIYLNLLMNSEDALANRPGPAVRARLECQDGECMVSFIDNGPGFSDAVRARLTDRTALPQLAPNLSGLGLWVATRIAEGHGGRLDIANVPDGGASVTLRLPAA